MQFYHISIESFQFKQHDEQATYEKSTPSAFGKKIRNDTCHVIKQHDIRKQRILIVYVHNKLNILIKNNTSRKREIAKPKMI